MPFRFVNLPPPGCRPRVSRCCRCRPFPPDFAGNTPAARAHSFTYCPNMVRNVPNFASFQSFAKLLLPDLVKFSVFAGFGCPRFAEPLGEPFGELFGEVTRSAGAGEHRPPGDSSPLSLFGRCWVVVIMALMFAAGGCCRWCGMMIYGAGWWYAVLLL